MEINIPDAEGIIEILKRMEAMDKEDLVCHAAFHTIATTCLFKMCGMEKEDVFAFVEAVGKQLDKALSERKRKWS